MKYCDTCGAPIDETEPNVARIGAGWELWTTPFGDGLRRGKEVVTLGPVEAKILGLLHHRDAVSGPTLVDLVSREDTVSISPNIALLRRKLERLAPELVIVTRREFGNRVVGSGRHAYYELEVRA